MSRRVLLALAFLLLQASFARAERMFTSGFEIATAATEWTTISGSPTFSSAGMRSGSLGMRITGLTSGARRGAFLRTVSTPTNGVRFLRFYLRVGTAPSAANRIAYFTETAVGGTQKAWVALNADRTLTVGDSSGTIDTTATALTLATWYYLNLEIDTTQAAGEHIVQLRINGVAEVTANDRTIADDDVAGFQIGGNLNAESQTQGEWDFDDVALNDESGTFNNATPGEGAVVHLLITGNGDTTNRGTQGTDWETGTGAIGSGTGTGGEGYQMIDEADPNDDTDWIEFIVNSTGSTNRIHYYAVGDPLAANIGLTDTISFVAWLTRVRGETSSTCTYVPSFRIGSGSTSAGNAQSNGATAWNYDTSSFLQWSPYWAYVSPDLVAWTTTVLDGLELGVRSPDANPDCHITWMAAQIEYVEDPDPPAAEWPNKLPYGR